MTGLISHPDIIRKPADKVVQDTTEYQREILSRLQDPRFYKKLPNDPASAHQSEVMSFLNNVKTQAWISQDIPISPVFNTLPKILREIQLWHGRTPFDLPYRSRCCVRDRSEDGNVLLIREVKGKTTRLVRAGRKDTVAHKNHSLQPW